MEKDQNNKSNSLTQIFIDTCINELTKKDTVDKCDKYFIDPILNKISSKIFNYFIIFVLIQICIIIMLFYSIYSIKTNK